MQNARRFDIHACLRLYLVVAFAALIASDVRAQSAADKATAREAATEGIKFYRDGRYSEALDRLKRAQALYDAPPHLLYIARAQVKLDEPQLVEAAENYRLLVRHEVDDATPAAFVDAIEAGKKELAELEPRIPKLTIELQPPDAEDAEVTIDGATVPAAAVGLARPVNPGQRVVAAEAPGYVRVERTVSVEEGEAASVELVLEPAATEKGEALPTGAGGAPASPEDKGKGGLFGFMVGLRLGAAIPGGSLGRFAGEDSRAVSDAFKPGGGLELHGGVRIAQLVTVALFGEISSLTPADKIPALGNAEKSASAQTGGLKVIIGTPRGRLGGFGEVGFGVSHQFSMTATFPSGCEVTAKASGSVLRLGGGAVFPIGRYIHLVPFGALSLGPFTEERYERSDCAAVPAVAALETRNIPSDEQETHTLLFLGVGGDFVFGADGPRD